MTAASDVLADAPPVDLAWRYRPVGRVRWYGGHAALGSAVGLAFGILQSLLAAPWMVVGVFLIVTLFVLRRARRGGQLAQANNEASALVGSGHVDSAVERFEVLVRQSQFQPVLHALAVYNLGVCRHWQGRLEEAIALMEQARSAGWLRRRCRALYPGMLASLASAYALRGDLDAARVTLAEARARATSSSRALTFTAEVLLACREGRWREASTLADRALIEGRLHLPDWHARTLSALGAFALAQQPIGTVSAGDLARMVSGARPATERGFEGLAARWPAFAQFLRSHGLLKA